MNLYPIEIILNEMNRYQQFSIDVFNYLNGRINPYNFCILTIKMYSKLNYAEFRKPNSVALFLGSIVNNYMNERTLTTNEKTIKNIILSCIAHELSHSWQNTDMVRYTNDPYYKKMVEDTNEAYTERWLLDHANEIKSLFGIKPEFTRYALKNIMPQHTNYQSGNLRDYYLHTIIDTVYRNDHFEEPLNRLFDMDDNIAISFDDSKLVFIKLNGEFQYNQIDNFGRLIYEYCRAGLGIKYFTISMTLTPIVMEDGTEALWARFLTSNVRYCPIVGIETVPQIENMNKNS